MEFLALLPLYIRWHYTRALQALIRISGNILWFEWHFFSVGILARTLLAPWQRLQESRVRGGGLEGFFSVLLINTIMRIVGFIIRLIFIFIGLISIIVSAVLSVIVFFSWIFLPIIIGFSFILGIDLLTQALI